MSRLELTQCSELSDLIARLKTKLSIPETEELCVCWSRRAVDVDTEDIMKDWKDLNDLSLRGCVPTTKQTFNSWKTLRSIKTLCCEPEEASF